MTDLSVTLDSERTSFVPGESISGKIDWNLAAAPKRLEARLFWFTRGKGTRDAGVVETMRVEPPSRSGSKGFSFVAPPGPASFSGRLVSLCWAIEAVAEPKGPTVRIDIVISPSGHEIDISGQVFEDQSLEKALGRSGCLFSPTTGRKPR